MPVLLRVAAAAAAAAVVPAVDARTTVVASTYRPTVDATQVAGVRVTRVDGTWGRLEAVVTADISNIVRGSHRDDRTPILRPFALIFSRSFRVAQSLL